jgi:hypothetical protein
MFFANIGGWEPGIAERIGNGSSAIAVRSRVGWLAALCAHSNGLCVEGVSIGDVEMEVGWRGLNVALRLRFIDILFKSVLRRVLNSGRGRFRSERINGRSLATIGLGGGARGRSGSASRAPMARSSCSVGERLGMAVLHLSAQGLQGAELQLLDSSFGFAQKLGDFLDAALFNEAFPYHAALNFGELLDDAEQRGMALGQSLFCCGDACQNWRIERVVSSESFATGADALACCSCRTSDFFKIIPSFRVIIYPKRPAGASYLL